MVQYLSSMLIKTILLLGLLSCLIVSNEGRSYECGSSFCVPVTADQCKGGVIKGDCGCFECAKVEGERCGGQLESGGYCEKHLVCSYPPDDLQGVEPGTCVTSDVGILVSEPDSVWSRFRNFFG